MYRAVAIAGLAVAVIALSACTGDVQPQPTPSTTVEDRLPDPAPPLALEQLEAFSGVAAMNAGSNCTGTLIDTGVDQGPAYILTNGHCVGAIGRSRQQTTLGVEWFGTAEFLRAEGNLDATHTVEVLALEYSTMHGTDTAIVRLDATLGELLVLGLQPVPIADKQPAAGADVVNIGVPVQGIDYHDWVLRRGDCTLGEQHTLIEFGWLWRGVWSNDCPGIVQGSSGSPLLSLGADGSPEAIVGMINTTSWGVSQADGGACFINRPCQVTADAVDMVEEVSYAQSVAGIGRCFDDATGEFSVGGACPLPVTSVWAEDGSGGSFQGGEAVDNVGRLPMVSFVGREAGSIRSVTVPLGDATACLRPETYAGATKRPVPQAGEDWEPVGRFAPVALPEDEGWYLVCAVMGDDYAGAASVLFEVDRTPPIFSADASIERFEDGDVMVRPHLNPPELSNVRFMWGPQGEVDCDDAAAFQDFFIVPLFIAADELPATYCIYGMDNAGNRSEVTQLEIPEP